MSYCLAKRHNRISPLTAPSRSFSEARPAGAPAHKAPVGKVCLTQAWKYFNIYIPAVGKQAHRVRRVGIRYFWITWPSGQVSFVISF